MKNNDAHQIIEKNLSNIIDLYWTKHISVQEIASKLNIGHSTLTKYLSERKLLRRVGQSSRQYTVNDNFFETIDTEQKAYWLGVLYADGCIVHIKNSKYLVLSSIDKDWLEQYRNDIQFDGPLLKEHHNKFDKDIWKVKVTSKKIYTDLLDKGITEAKSLHIQLPTESIVPNRLLHHFLRGFFDGDGSVGLYKNKKSGDWKRLHVSFTCGSLVFVTALTDLFSTLNITPFTVTKRKDREVYSITFSLLGGLKLRDYLYRDATVYLQRKRDKFFLAEKPKRTFNDYNRVSSTEDKGIVCSHAKV